MKYSILKFNRRLIGAICVCAAMVVTGLAVYFKMMDESKQAVWWDEMQVKITPQRDETGSIFALDLLLTNRSKYETALFKLPDLNEDIFIVEISTSVDEPALWEQMSLRQRLYPPVPDGVPYVVYPTVRIPPGSTLRYCLKIEKDLTPESKLNTTSKYLLTVISGNELAWERAAGYTTGFGYENDAAYSAKNWGKGVVFDFGFQKLSIHKNRSCDGGIT